MSGFQIQRHLLDSQSPLPVLFLSQYATIDAVVRVMKAGAVDFFEDPFDEQKLWEAIQQAIHLCQRRLRHRQRQLEWHALVESLNNDERELLDMLLEGRRSREIASAQKIALRTVEARRARLMKKLQVDSTTKLIQVASERTSRRCSLHGGQCFSLA